VALEVTGGALAFIRAIGATGEPASEKTFRLIECHGGFGFTFDDPKQDDKIFLSDGLRVLCVSPDVARLALDTTVKVEETPTGRQLTFSLH
jgi:hypothetical protein